MGSSEGDAASNGYKHHQYADSLYEFGAPYRLQRLGHEIKGLRAFVEKSFAGQLATPGMVVIRVVSQGVTVGAYLWYLQDAVAHSHLAASNALGYELMALLLLPRSNSTSSEPAG